jgi:ribonuclease PH
MAESGDFIEVQGTAEGNTFNRDELNSLLDLASDGIAELIVKQREALALG